MYFLRHFLSISTLFTGLGVADALAQDPSDPAAPKNGKAARVTVSPGQATLPETITVSAARRPVRADEIGTSLSIITEQDIQLRQRRTLPDLLKTQPGLNLVQTGGPGGTTSIFMRGTNANEVKVRLDGMDINDPSTPGGAFDPAQFLTDGIGRVEILRGPQSGLYGADAMGGVIDITSIRGDGPMKAMGRIEGGSFGTFNQMLGVRGGAGRFHYAVYATHSRVEDVQVTPPRLIPQGVKIPGSRNDNRSANVRLGYDVTDNFDLGLTAHLTQGTYRYVGDNYNVYPPVPMADRSTSNLNQAVVRGTAHLRSFGGRFDQIIGLGYSVYRRRDLTAGEAQGTDIGNPAYNRGGRVKIDWHGTTDLGRAGTLLVGAEHIHEVIWNSPITAHTDTNAGYGQYQGQWRHILFGAANVRYDSNSRYGNYVTWRVAPAIHVPHTGTVIKASAGSGYHGPSLNQLFVSYPAYFFVANPNLKAERLLGYDAGVQQTLLQGRLNFGATWYESKVDNLINTGLSGYDYTYVNVARARLYGVESFVDWKALDTLDLTANYTWTVAKDMQTGQELQRRPRHKFSFSAVWTATPGLTFTPTILYVSHWRDVDRYGMDSDVKAHGYFTIDLAAQYRVNRYVTVFARADNLLNRQFENPIGYLQPGRAGYGGVTLAY
ncbi:TonB-dependent receptor plug domain-containing protein [Gluconacetobacter tumulisoli]|uniref:TonB-dependent receptor n=1 Tax=Gluconacetobacter tumulisoli TaxID=1286189 RepID=A0A7W4PKM6_9PROT|nr:TonB-dependent receptor [Gluconacetobacter tumulisoli]MBB2201547.1 TonB-dependent receptor [Gluconacetobacter tumulisoli]